MFKQPTQLLGALYGSKTPSPTFDESRETKRAARVWIRLTEMYGAKFSKEFGSEPNDTWTATIDRMADAEIAASLRALAEKGSPHPPSLGEFVAASKPPKPETGSPRYLGANPINVTELRIAGALP
jgi:hypothetical protein